MLMSDYDIFQYAESVQTTESEKIPTRGGG